MFENLIVIGIGNLFRSDDALGLLIVRKLREIFANEITFCEHSSDGTALIELWEDRQIVFLIDAIYANELSGNIYRFNLVEENLPVEWFSSSHAFNIAEAVELARVLGKLPPQLTLYGITSNNFEMGTSISTEVCQAMEKVVKQIADELNNIMSKQ